MTYILTESLMHLLHRASQAADDQFAGHPAIGQLTARQFVVMSAIAAREGASQTAISEVTGIDRSTLADVIGRLHRRGLVWRRRTKRDARAYAVRLTEAGHKVLAEATPSAEWVDGELISYVPAAKRGEFLRLLRGLVDGPAVPREPARAPKGRITSRDPAET